MGGGSNDIITRSIAVIPAKLEQIKEVFENSH